MIYNSKKLLAELQAFGLPAISADSNGNVVWADGTEHTDKLLADLATVLKAHDPTDPEVATDATIQSEWEKSPLYKLPPDQIIQTLQTQIDACKDLDSLKLVLHNIIPLLTITANRTAIKDASSAAVAVGTVEVQGKGLR